MTTDRLTLAQVMEDAGFEHDKAARVASAIFEAINDNVATKSDLTTSTSELKAEIADTRAELKAEIANTRAELKAEITGLRHETKIRFERVERQIDQVVIRLGALMVASLGVFFAAPHLFG